MSHEHAFGAVPLAAGQYRCACGATAYRSLSTGALVVHRKPRRRLPELTVTHGAYWDEEVEPWDGRRVGPNFFRTPDQIAEAEKRRLCRG